ncbi:DUF6477 family protein [Pseudoroseicyclus aestuarii]|uniref:Uncharacterized protein n=1 Tax=Pseudoroseicyclus aestuarii TaxID=1795041 RepID=A0A318T0K4_9RHOB|nr:DUF6477 family protein [Pseudoroseicyclus aestuarii]PYE86149.1 hypothetical protein DFP88_101826 [Pseudoroseicyclus aestuarii]
MHDIQTRIADLRRPPLLVQAACFGLGAYDRERHLPRLLAGPMAPALAAPRLLEEEAEAERMRRAGSQAYSLRQHVALLTALLGEAREIRERNAGEAADIAAE